jgi:DNA-binding beta-propeller fold protein YncE
MALLLGEKTIASALKQPMDAVVSRGGQRLYVTDYAKPGVFIFDFETRSVQPLGEADLFKTPFGIALDDQDNVYVADSGPKLIYVFDPQGAQRTTITHPSLERPTGLAIDTARRRLYVADPPSQTIKVFDLDGTYRNVLGGEGTPAGHFASPTYLAVDGTGHLYVTDTLDAQVKVLDADGRRVRTVGEHGDAYGMLDKPKGVAVDSLGNVYVVDSAWSNVQIFNQQGQVLLFFGGRGRVPGLLFNPAGLTIDADNRIYVADAFNARVALYELINTKAEDSVMQPKGGGL